MLITNTAYLNENYDIEIGKTIQIENDRIIRIANNDQFDGFDTEIMDGSDLLFMPGLIDSHLHIGQQLLKGKVLDAKGIIWQNIMLPFESTLDERKMALNAKLAALEMIHAGTTSFIDAGSYHMESACEILAQSGLRGAVSYSTMDDDTLPESICETAKDALNKTNQLYDCWHNVGNLKVFYSLRSLLSVSKECIEMISQEAINRKAMLQVHMNEYEKEVDTIIKQTGMRPYEYLASLNCLNERFIGAHSLLLDEHEMQLLIEHDCKVVHCPFSNSGKSLPNTPELIKKGVVVALGSDGAAHGGLSLWNEMRILRCMMNVTHGLNQGNRSIMPAKDLLKMATENGAKLLQEPNLGKIKEGYLADMIAIDLSSSHLCWSHNYTNTLVECVNEGDIIHSMVNGKWIMKDRKVLTIDEEAILNEVRGFNK